MFTFLMVIQALIAAALVGVILIQKSEGGGLGVGGSPSGFMSARGAAEFLTRTTQVLGGLFVVLSIVLAAMAVQMGGAQKVDTSLNRTTPAAPVVPADPLSGAAGSAAAPAAAASPAAAATPAAGDPLAPATHK